MAPNPKSIAKAQANIQRPIKVVSGFDGIAGARAALDEAGVPVESYMAYETDPYAVAIASKNYPDIQHRGDVRSASRADGSADLLCAGFPCQDLSRGNGTGKGLDGERSGMFWEIPRMLDEFQPKHFLVENVVPRGSKGDRNIEIVSKALGVDPVFLDAKDFGPMARPRAFWTNIPVGDYTPSQAIFRDALLGAVPDKYQISPKGVAYLNRQAPDGRTHFQKHGFDINDPKARTIPSVIRKGVPYNALQLDDGSFRRMTPQEIEGLFGFPQGYTEGVSDYQRYKALGNSWSVPTVSHILQGLSQ